MAPQWNKFLTGGKHGLTKAATSWLLAAAFLMKAF
jgi:hypothetical protein